MAIFTIGIEMQKLKIDAYVVDTLLRDLCGHDRQPSAFLVYLFLYRQTRAIGQKSVAMSLRQMAEATGLSRRSVQNAVSRLDARHLIKTMRGGMTDIPEYFVLSPWRR